MGIVVTMGRHRRPGGSSGEKVKRALVGTFLGILLSYGFCSLGREAGALRRRIQYFRTIAARCWGSPKTCLPKWPSSVATRRGQQPAAQPRTTGRNAPRPSGPRQPNLGQTL